MASTLAPARGPHQMTRVAGLVVTRGHVAGGWRSATIEHGQHPDLVRRNLLATALVGALLPKAVPEGQMVRGWQERRRPGGGARGRGDQAEVNFAEGTSRVSLDLVVGKVVGGRLDLSLEATVDPGWTSAPTPDDKPTLNIGSLFPSPLARP